MGLKTKEYTLDWNNEKIKVSQRKVKLLRLTITSSGEIKITAPIFVSKKNIIEFLISKQNWIEENKKKVYVLNKEKELKNGSSVFLWGKKYCLEITKSTKNKIVFYEDKAVIQTNDLSQENLQKILKAYYKKELKKVLPCYIEKWENITGLKVNGFSIRDMKTRWGSCNVVNHTISINVQVVKKEIDCLDYLVLHEVAHIKEKSHNQNFKNFLSKYMFNWKILRKNLKN